MKATANPLLAARRPGSRLRFAPGGEIPPWPLLDRLLVGCAVLLAGTFALSGAVGGLYGFADWGLVLFGACTVVAALGVVTPLTISGPARTALIAGLFLLGWSAASLLWAESVDQTWLEILRLGLYLAILAITLFAVRVESAGWWIVGTIGVVTAGIGAFILVQLGLGAGNGLFLDFRLTDPLGYVNAEGAYFVIGLWALIGLAERPGPRAARALAAGAASALAGLVVLTQSRGAMLGLALSAVTVMIVVPGRVRRGYLLLAVGLGVCAALPWTLDVYAARGEAGSRLPGSELQQAAAIAVAILAVAVSFAWAIISRALDKPPSARRRLALVTPLVALPLALFCLGLIQAGPIANKVSKEYERFTSLHERPSSQRFTSAGGYRYDYWRIAVNEFAERPILGVGLGNYSTRYVSERRNADYVRQPHSLPLQVLSELGVVGMFGLLAGCAALMRAVLRFRSLASDPPTVALFGASLGIVTAWALQTSVDWLHNVPGVTGLAVLSSGILLMGPAADSRGRIGVAGFGSVVAMAAAALLAAGGGLYYAAEQLRDSARPKVRTEPLRALETVERSLRLNPESMPSHYLRSAAFARLGEYRAARSALLVATVKEPRNYVPWALLGELAVRRGDLTQATDNFRRAHKLNPFDPTLKALARDPTARVNDG